jgi:hypothetical protein
MSNSPNVTALRVADEDFLVASMIERCPKTMMIRELVMNAIEAAINAPAAEQTIELMPRWIGGVEKLCIWNSGPGMSSEELHQICDLAASIGKDKGLDDNFGMGAKVASLPSNRYGLRYRSCKRGLVSEVVLCQRDNVYGRLRRMSEAGSLEEVFDVTSACLSEGYDLSRDWTEVVLFGNRADQNTLRDPYEQNPAMNGQWLADYLYHRFYRLPPGLVVRFKPGAHKLDGTRVFRTIPERAYPLGKSECVTLNDGTKIHYFYDPPLANSSHNKSVSGAITTDVSTCAIVYKNEFYDLMRGRQWTLDAPIFGVTFGAKHISIHIELPDGCSVRPEAYRQFLRYREADQRQVVGQDFAHLVRENRPTWLIELINSLAPTDSGGTKEIRDELQRLLNSLRVKKTSPRLNPSGDVTVEFGTAGGGSRAFGEGEGQSEGKSSRIRADDLLAVPAGAKRARISLNAERAPEIIPLHDESAIEEKGLKGKAAKFYPEAGQLFVNMHYHSVAEMRTQLELEYAHASEPETMRRMAKELAERTMIIRVGRAVVYALAKQLNQEWTTEDMARAQSPESLSIAADDFIDGLQNVRRRMGIALRAGRLEPSESIAS